MAHTAYTLRLDPAAWDLTLTRTGGIATASGAEAIAQNVANECRLFTKDAYYEQDRGIPYFIAGLGRNLAESVLRTRWREAALSVDGVKEVTSVVIDGVRASTRELTGEIQFIMTGSGDVTIDQRGAVEL